MTLQEPRRTRSPSGKRNLAAPLATAAALPIHVQPTPEQRPMNVIGKVARLWICGNARGVRRPPRRSMQASKRILPPTNNIVASQNSDASAAPIRQAANAWTASSARRQIARQDHDRSIELIAQSAGLELEPRPRAFRTNEQMVDLSGLLHHPVERLLNL